MIRRSFVWPWFVGIVFVLAVSVADARAGDQSGASSSPAKATSGRATKKPSIGGTERLPAIIWYRNAIHNAAIDVCVRPGDQCVDVLSILNDEVKRFQAPAPAATMTARLIRPISAQCRWLCPPGDCGPDCWRFLDTSFQNPKSIPANARLSAIGSYVNALESAAIEHDSGADSFAQIRGILEETLKRVVDVRDKR